MVLAVAHAALHPAILRAQRDTVPRRDTVAQRLQSVRTTVTRDAARSTLELPFAVTTAPLTARSALRRE